MNKERTKCPECVARGKTWDGDDPKCAFETGTFNTDNWNCATMNILRNIAGEDREHPIEGCYYRRDDLENATIGVIPCRGDTQGYLVMSWYKRRGKTGQAVIMVDGHEPSKLTLAEAQEIISQYKDEENGYR